MNRKLTLPACALAMMVGLSACDLSVANPNNPDRERALASAEDVETLISSAYQQYFGPAQYWNQHGPATNHMSNRHAASWGNYGLNDLGREPREPLPNTPSFTYAYVFENPWQDNYAGIAAASDGLKAIDNGLEIGAGGADNQRAIAFAKFNQGIATCVLAQLFDQAFIIDETTDLAGELVASPYMDVFNVAMTKLDEALAAAQGNSFTLPDPWLAGNALSNTEFASLIRGYRARCAANIARSGAEAATIDWNAISQDASNSFGDLIIQGEETGPWWSGIKTLGGTENSTWHRMHLNWSGMADVTGEYQTWLNTPLNTRNAIPISTPDQRYPANNVDGEKGLYHRYNSANPFRAERGNYRQSHYGDLRYDAYLNSCAQCYFGPFPEMTAREMRMYMAEAAFRNGDVATTVSILNETRVANGGLPALVDGGTVPGGANCVPRKRYDPAGTCGDLRDALIYEHFEEVYAVSAGLEFYHGRRFDILPSGTAIHFPIPATDLETLELDIYTFGGGGPGSAPNRVPVVVPGDLNSALQRAAFTLGRVEQRQQSLERARSAGLVVR